jgi:translocator protein
MNSWNDWYQSLNKPSWTPDPSIIGLIWTLLYPIIFVSFGYAVYLFSKGKFTYWVLVPFAINLIANFAFTPLFMGQRNLTLAFIDILVVLATIVWIMIAIYPYSKGIFYAQVPYLIWVSVATTVMGSIYYLNR